MRSGTWGQVKGPAWAGAAAATAAATSIPARIPAPDRPMEAGGYNGIRDRAAVSEARSTGGNARSRGWRSRATMHAPRPLIALLLAALTVGCEAPAGSPPVTAADGGGPATTAPSPAASTVAEDAPGTGPAAAGSAPASAAATRTTVEAEQAARLRHFVEVVDGLSEPDAAFFSDNLVSNETSFLHVADELPRAAPRGAAYVGVGPEQNFAYIALLDPSVAYVVDIRRDNLRLHLLYKAAFELGATRADFLALLLGRPAPAGTAEGDDVAAVLAHATAAPPTEESFATAHAALGRRIASWGLRLDRAEHRRLEAIHRRFHGEQLGLRFALKEANGRTYPTLREMLSATDRAGAPRGFLASDAAYQTVARLQREHRVIPVVGDFAGDRALPGLARAMTARGTPLGTFYVSNVEQYLLEPAVWSRWRRNVAALPRAEGAVFVRAWLDQGRPHPRQVEGHRTATVVASIDGFEAAQRERPYGSWWAIATDALIEPVPSARPAPDAAARPDPR